MKRLATTTLVSISLTCITVTLLFTAIGIGLVPDPTKVSLDARADLCGALAIQLSTATQKKQVDLFMDLAPQIVRENSDILSIGIRRSDDHVLAATENHRELWGDGSVRSSTATHVQVPILHGDQRFGAVEVCFTPLIQGTRAVLDQFHVPLILFVALSGLLVYHLYLKRVLRQLDPSSVVPDRVRRALDTLSESVVITDTQERIVLANEAFARITGQPTASLLGRKLSRLPWIKRKSERSLVEPPWADVLRHGTSKRGLPLILQTPAGEVRNSLVNTSPIAGADGKQRGVMTSFTDVTELEDKNRELVKISRLAGMAEVATDVLHNVGNVLNSVSVAATSIRQDLSDSQLPKVKLVTEMIAEHKDDLGPFLTKDSRGKHIPSYLVKAIDVLIGEQEHMRDKIQSLTTNVDHIKEIIRMQQSHAKTTDIKITVLPSEVVEDAIQINNAKLKQNAITVVREFGKTGTVDVDKPRVLQIVTNLIRNAIEALADSDASERLLTLKSYLREGGSLRIEVCDNGIGIAAENVTKIFRHGFTTKEGGHGFGLHSSAIAATEMGGSLSGVSDGPGQGANFVLELPLELEREGNEDPSELETANLDH